MDPQTPYFVGFSHMLGIGPHHFQKLVKLYKTPKRAYTADLSDLKKLLGSKTAEKFGAFRTHFDPHSKVKALLKKHIHIIPFGSTHYPASLRAISDPPICLYLKGDKNIFHSRADFITIVGTRKPTEYGISVATRLARDLSDYGFVIVSGMALGIDAIAHWSALKSRGKTVAVLGNGVDLPRPISNEGLYHTIIKQGGAVLSEFPPGMTTQKGLFVARNRLVSGLSKGVLVIEGTKHSGTLITARYAAQQGRDVFAVPGPITSMLSQAPNLLLKQGALVVTSAQDVLEAYNVKLKKADVQKRKKRLTGPAKEIFTLLAKQSCTPDTLAKSINTSIERILQSLTILEIEGIVKKQDDGAYGLKDV